MNIKFSYCMDGERFEFAELHHIEIRQHRENIDRALLKFEEKIKIAAAQHTIKNLVGEERSKVYSIQSNIKEHKEEPSTKG
ncbi:hypothetical protein FZW96_11075 [Bacillus sp. BGMRC 2118]|nr:hypothetical protein FZW96_11075 [Bacillus sp. BGMRC 2118]